MNNFIGKDGRMSSDVAFGVMLGTSIERDHEGSISGPGVCLLDLAILALNYENNRAELEGLPLFISLTSSNGEILPGGEAPFERGLVDGVSISIDKSKLSEEGKKEVLYAPYLQDSIAVIKSSVNRATGIIERKWAPPHGQETYIPYFEDPIRAREGYPFNALRERFVSTASSLFTRWGSWTEGEDGLWVPPTDEVDQPADES